MDPEGDDALAPARPGAGAGVGVGDGDGAGPGGMGGGGVGVGLGPGVGDGSGGGAAPPVSCANRRPYRGERTSPVKVAPATARTRTRAAGRTFMRTSYFKGFALMLTLLSLEYILKSIVSQSTWPLMAAACRAISRAKESNDGVFLSPAFVLAATKFW